MLKLTITVGPTTVDYSHYLDWRSVQLQEQINVPATLTFNLQVIDWKFRLPVPRAYVRLSSINNGKSLFTGFISVEPTKQWIALSPNALYVQSATGGQVYNGGQLLSYQCTATSDEYLLNLKCIPFVPAFVNRSQGDILTSLANLLCPGFYDTTMIASGDLVPFFQYTPTQSWCEIAKQFGDASRFRYKVRDKRIWYQPYGDDFLGVSYDEVNQTEAWFDPNALKTTVLQVPTVNDATIIGDAEAGNNHEDYFCGDGFTANLPLHFKVFHGSSVVLLKESWNEQALNEQQWYLQDPGSNFDFSAGALNIVTSPGLPFGASGNSYLSMNNGLELAGGLNLQHGEFVFNEYCSGVVGGLYLDETFGASGYLGGFNISSPSGIVTSASGAAGVFIQPHWDGADVGKSVITQSNHTYVLQTVVHAPKYVRWTQTYRTIDGEEYGGGSFSVTGAVTFNIQDYDIAQATGFYYTPQIYQSTVHEVTLPDFAAYALANNDVLNITDTNTTVAKMPLGGLSGLLGACGLYTPSGLVLPMVQNQWEWGVPPSGNYLNQPMPPTPSPLTVNLHPNGNQYYVGGVSTFSAVAASGAGATSTTTVTATLDDFTSGWQDEGPGQAILGGVSYTSGPFGFNAVEVNIVAGASNQVGADYDIIKTGLSSNMSISGSTNAAADIFTVYFKQDQPVHDSLEMIIKDVNGLEATTFWNFSAGSTVNNWITLTMPRSSFYVASGFDWTQVVYGELYNDAVYPAGLTSFNVWLAGAYFSGQTVTVSSPTTNYISLLKDPLFSQPAGAGEVVGSWTYDAVPGGGISAEPDTGGDPTVAGAQAVRFYTPVGTEFTVPANSNSPTFEVMQTVAFVPSPGDQYTLGLHAEGTPGWLFDQPPPPAGTQPTNLWLVMFLEAVVSYADGTQDTAAAGGQLDAWSTWQSYVNQMIVDATKTPTGMTVYVGGYWQNLSDQPITIQRASMFGYEFGWSAKVTAAGLVKTPVGYNVYPNPLGASAVPTTLVLGNGFDLQAAQITQGNDADTLSFYAQTSPATGTPIRFQSWENQAAVSRLQDLDSINFEKYVVGDDGVRSAIISDLNPLPRTSEDCDNAALAYLADHTAAAYNGTYTCSSLFFSGFYSSGNWTGDAAASGVWRDSQFWPTTGRFLHVHSPYRGIEHQEYLVSSLSVSVLEEATELLQYQIGFGADTHLEKVLKSFVDLKPASVLVPNDLVTPPNPRYTIYVGDSYLPDLAATYIPLGAITPYQAYVQMNDTLATASGAWLEVRLLDTNWGDTTKRDFVARYTDLEPGSGFWLQRATYDQQWFMRQVALAPSGVPGSGPSGAYITSRRSKVLRLHWPLQPSQPLLVSQVPDSTGIATAALQFNFNGDQRNIYGFELRCADNYTVIVQKPVASYADMNIDLAAATPLPYLIASGTYTTLLAYFFNQQWSYSTPTVVPVIVPAPIGQTSSAGNSATFGIGIGGAQPVGDDLTPHYMCRVVGGNFSLATANCKTWGSDTSTPLHIDIKISKDQAITWNTIFGAGYDLTVPAPSTSIAQQSVFNPAYSKIDVGDMLRIDLLSGSNATCQNIEVCIQWGS